jgi:hypothetical protein
MSIQEHGFAQNCTIFMHYGILGETRLSFEILDVAFRTVKGLHSYVANYGHGS